MKRSLLSVCLFSCSCASFESSLYGPDAVVEHPAAATVSVALADLDAMSPEEIALLEQHLTSSVAWVVRGEHGRRTAYRNWMQSDGKWIEEFNGYWSNFDLSARCPDDAAKPLPSPRCSSPAIVQGRVLVALEEPTRLSHRDRGQFSRTPPQGTVTLALEDYMEQPGRHSWLVVEGERLMVEVMEQAAPDSRPFTQAAVDSLRDELAAVRAGAEEIRARGFVSDWAPAAGWTDGDAPPLTLIDAERPGRYTLGLWLNPGAPGQLSLKLIYLGPASTGTPPDGLSVGDEVHTNQYGLTTRLGWGADPTVRFRTSAAVWVEQGTPGEAFSGRLEVHFTPDDGGPGRVLASHTQDFTGREPLNPPTRNHHGGAL